MALQYEASFHHENGEFFLTWTMPDGSQDTTPLNQGEITRIDELCEHIHWPLVEKLSQDVGDHLFTFLNGNEILSHALQEADARGELLHLSIRSETFSDIPFELLHQKEFLVPLRIHMFRRVSDWGWKRKIKPQNRPLRILVMACSPEGISSIEFEREEDTIFEITKTLPVDIDVEDTGSLEGLTKCLSQNEYDIIHLSGHADIDEGEPFFWMEDEEGGPAKVSSTMLWESLNQSLTLPRLIFLSACRTGQAPPQAAASFAHYLVLKHSSLVLGWGRPVSDSSAIMAAETLYFELSRGRSIADAVFSTRNELFNHSCRDWSLLRLFSDGTPLDVPLVQKGQKRKVRQRDIQYTYLENSQIKVLKKGFVGRRRQIQRAIKSLREDETKVGLLIHGTGGLGKSCLAGKLCERFDNHALIIVHGKLDTITFFEALKAGFILAEDRKGLKILKEKEEVPDKIMRICSSSFQEKNYLILLDDFEKNLENIGEGTPVVSQEAALILKSLLKYLPYAAKMSQVLITSRYSFSLGDGRDLMGEKLESIGLTSFQGADEKKKISTLYQIASYPDTEMRQKLIVTGGGNPRLMEALDSLLKVEKNLDLKSLLKEAQGKQEEFVQGLVLREIVKRQKEEFKKVLHCCAAYGLPVLKKGIERVCSEVLNWEYFLGLGVQLGLVEEDVRKDNTFYWVTPLLREELFHDLDEGERRRCHRTAVEYYRNILSGEGYDPLCAFELIEHALQCEMHEIAVEEGGKLLQYLKESLAYKKALSEGEHILSELPEPKRDGNLAHIFFEFGEVHDAVGHSRKAVEYFEKALSICREVYGERHSKVATVLNSLGDAWRTLGYPRKAIEYYEQALEIDREVYGEKHKDVAQYLTNLGSAWGALGDYKKAIDYCEKALLIMREMYGETHQTMATIFNSLGIIWRILGNPEKAIDYYEKAISIDREVYGERHPKVATRLNNLGVAWRSLGYPRKAVEYHEQALSIRREVYGERHPKIALTNSSLGITWRVLGNPKKALEYYEKALSIDREMYGERHPSVARDLHNVGCTWRVLGDPKKALRYCEEALSIVREVYGERHPTVATVLNSLGLAWGRLGDQKKALEYYEKALFMDREVYGERHPSVAGDLRNIGSAWRTLGDSKKTIEYCEKALSIIGEMYGERHPRVATTLTSLGLAWGLLGDPKKALEHFEQALAIDKEIYGERHTSVARDLKNMGSVWRTLGDPKKAINYLEQAYDMFKEFLGDENYRTEEVKKQLDSLIAQK